MRPFGNQGVLFSDAHFSEETLAWLLQSPGQTIAEAAPPPPETVQHTPESAFAAAWEEMSTDPDLLKAMQQAGYSREKGRVDFSQALAAPVATDAAAQLRGALKVDYVVKVEGGNFVHRLDGEAILSIPPSVQSAPVVSGNALAVMYAMFMVVDVLGIVAAAFSVHVFVRKSALAKELQTPLQKFLRLFVTTGKAAELKKVEGTEKSLEILKKVLAALRQNAKLPDVFKMYAQSLPPLQIAIAVVQVIAGVALIFASGGAALAAKVAELAVAVVQLGTDTGSFVAALEQK